MSDVILLKHTYHNFFWVSHHPDGYRWIMGLSSVSKIHIHIHIQPLQLVAVRVNTKKTGHPNNSFIYLGNA